MVEHKCKKCGKDLNERGSDNDLEYCDGFCAECYEKDLEGIGDNINSYTIKQKEVRNSSQP